MQFSPLWRPYPAQGGPFKCHEILRKRFSPLRRCSESRVGLVNYQEASRKQFSPLWRFCEAFPSLFICKESSRMQFSPLLWSCKSRGGLFKCRKYREIRLHHCGSAVNLVLAWLSTWGHSQSSFRHCGGPIVLKEVCLSARKY